jgi:HlyD family secretion protein
MQRRYAILAAILAVALALGAGLLALRRGGTPPHYTGFVEGEERILRSEVTGRVLDVRYREGDAVSPDAVVARLDDADARARIRSKRGEIDMLAAEIREQEERIALLETTWRRDVSARAAELARAQSAADLAERTLARERQLRERGVTTAQALDDARARRDQAQSELTRAREMLARAEAEARTIAVARHELEALRARRELAHAQLAELELEQSKFEIHAPATETVVQTQFIWPGELARPGTAILSVLDPLDKYVEIYVPVPDLARVRLGQRVAIELDSRPGERVGGEIVFIADEANFTPEKIETRSDRLGQVYRAKVKILEGVERFQPGTEGNVYLLEAPAASASPSPPASASAPGGRSR